MSGDKDIGAVTVTLRNGAAVAIGEDIEVVLLKERGNRAMICVKAPRHLKVYRKPAVGEAQYDDSDQELKYESGRYSRDRQSTPAIVVRKARQEEL